MLIPSCGLDPRPQLQFQSPCFLATWWCLPLGSARPRLQLELVSKGRGCPGDLASSHAMPSSTSLLTQACPFPRARPSAAGLRPVLLSVCPHQHQSCLVSPLSAALSPHLDSRGHTSQAALQGDGTDRLRVSLSRLPQTSHLCTELLNLPFCSN